MVSSVVIAVVVVACVTACVAVLASYRGGWVDRPGVEGQGEGMRRLLDSLPDAVLGVNAEGSITFANQRAARLAGRSVDEMVGRSFVGFVSPDDRDDITDRWRRLRLDPTLTGRVVFDLVGRGGLSNLVEASMHSSFDGGDDAVLLLRSVGDRAASTDALEQARRRFQCAFHSAPNGMALVTTGDDRIIDANQTLSEMLGLERTDVIGMTMRQLVHRGSEGSASPERARAEVGIETKYSIEQQLVRADGRVLWAKIQASIVEEDGDELSIIHIEDISEQRLASRALAHAASHDALTNLANRASIVHALEVLLASAGTDEVAVLFIDLDGFKAVNDTFGHSAGDQLLRHAAHRFTSVMRSCDRVARLGGDEFVVVVDGTPGEDRRGPLQPERVVERLQQSMIDPVVIAAREITVAASIGVATNQLPGMTADDLLREADAAMYRAKAQRRAGRERIERDADLVAPRSR